MRRAAFALALLPSLAQAAGFDEFQIFDGRITEPGSFDLNIHLNHGRQGRLGDGAPRNGWLLTPELGYATTPWHEVALFLPVARDTAGKVFEGGFKVRNTFVTPGAADRPVAAGFDIELRNQPYRFAGTNWAVTLRPILDLRTGRWQLILNPAIDVPIGREGPGFAPAVRVVRRVADRVWIGVEHYMDFGRISRPEAPRGQAQQLFLTIDLKLGDTLGLQLGGGPGLTPASDRWAVKAILAFDL